MIKTVIVEDDLMVASINSQFAKRNPNIQIVATFHNGKDALDYLKKSDADLVLLDLYMPDCTGLELLSELRNSGREIDVIMITAANDAEHINEALQLGIVDYLIKPFSLEELCARLRSMLRTSHGQISNILSVGDLTLDCSSHHVARAGKEITLSSKEYALLEYLMHNQGLILSREKIENHIWNFDYEGGTNVVDVYISYLRRKIDSGHERHLIHTVRGRGYVLREDTDS